MAHNVPKVKDNELFNKVRKAIYHRALWLGFIVKEAQKKGYDWEDMCRKAVGDCGVFQGMNGKNEMDQDSLDSLIAFSNQFFPEETQRMFDMDKKCFTEDEVYFEFGYCPLVQAWEDQGFSGKELETLCDIAMEGDRNITGCFGGKFKFELGKTIAQGYDVCEVRFKKVK